MPPASVLIVDDHAGFRAVVRQLLVALEYDVVGEAADGWTAVGLVERLRPELVVVDVRLPGVDGFAVARHLATRPSAPVIVLVSTGEEADFGGRIAASGAAGFITKSRLSGDTLRAVLERWSKELT